MNGKCPAFFQGTQCLQQDRLTVFGRNVVVDVIAGNCVDAGPSGIRSFAAGTMARAPAVPPINEATIPFGIQFL